MKLETEFVLKIKMGEEVESDEVERIKNWINNVSLSEVKSVIKKDLRSGVFGDGVELEFLKSRVSLLEE